MENENMEEKVFEMINNGEIGKTYISSEMKEKYKKESRNQMTSETMKRTKQLSMKKKRELMKQHKTIREGFNCIIIWPNGIVKKNIVSKGTEVEFLESKIGNNVLSFMATEIEVDSLSGGNMKVFYSPDSKGKVNKKARILFPEELPSVRGVVILYSEKIDLSVKDVEDIIERHKKYL